MAGKIMTEHLRKIAKTGETSSKNPSIGIAKTSIQEQNMDFFFTMRPLKVLSNAFEALADFAFNPTQEAVIEVNRGGCEITVWNFNTADGNECFGCLRLNATGLEAFQCRIISLRKLFYFSGILSALKAALWCEAEFLTLYSVRGSNKLSFRWGTHPSDFGLGLPLRIPLKDIDTPFESFPENVEYGLEAVYPSPVLRSMFVNMRSQAVPHQSTKVQMNLQSAIVEVHSGSVRSGSQEGLDDGQEHKVSMLWGFWKALENASHTADKCSIYLVTMPGDSIMLRFHLNQLGDLVFLNNADFTQLHEDLVFPDLGHFRRLNRQQEL